jgi:hypothetical protein
MSSWGLLKGLGKGLSDSASIMSQGMSEGRATERERIRNESIERRWKSQTDLTAKNRAEDVAHRNKQAKTSSDQFNHRMSSEDRNAVVNNLNSVMEQQAKSEQQIKKSFAKQMELGSTPELEAQMQAEIKANQMYYSERLYNLVGSYGEDGLKGTGFEYLLDVKAEPEEKAPEQMSNMANNNQPSEVTGLLSSITSEQPSGVVETGKVPDKELTFANLLRKWRDQGATPATTEQIDFRNQVSDSGVQSGYGAAFLNKGRN